MNLTLMVSCGVTINTASLTPAPLTTTRHTDSSIQFTYLFCREGSIIYHIVRVRLKIAAMLTEINTEIEMNKEIQHQPRASFCRSSVERRPSQVMSTHFELDLKEVSR